MRCDRAADIHAYHDGELSPAGRIAAQAHLRECAACRRLLEDLRGLASMLRDAPLPDLPGRAVGRMSLAFASSRDREVRRLAGWLTAAAAMVLVGSYLTAPGSAGALQGRQTAFEPVAEMLPIEPRGEAGAETMELAQWIADDLSHSAMRDLP